MLNEVGRGEIDRRTVAHRGVNVTVMIDADSESTPFEADCYTPEDRDGWADGLWRYVTVTLAVAIANTEVSESVSGVEWSLSDDASVGTDWDDIIAHIVPDVFRSLLDQVRKAHLDTTNIITSVYMAGELG